MSLQSLMESRREQREKEARHRAARVLRMLRKKGVRATVVGSLAHGTRSCPAGLHPAVAPQTLSRSQGRFRLHSDVDFLVTACPPQMKYTLESQVEDMMEGMPFDILYGDECRAE